MTIDYDFNVNEWLDPANYPINGTAWNIQHLKYFNIHWTGGEGKYAPSNVDKEKKTLNAIQKHYVTERGYSIGYSSAVGLSGNSYEVRGVNYRAASNGDSEDLDDDVNAPLLDNLEVYSCLLIISQDDQINDLMIQGVRDLYSSVCIHLNRRLHINGHNDLDYTECPGPQARNLIDKNAFYPTTPDSEDDMNIVNPPKRVIDTRSSGGPVSGSKSFNLQLSSPNISKAEVTITAIPTTAVDGFVGLNNKDSFLNWKASDVGRPIPATLVVPVSGHMLSLYVQNPANILISVRQEG